MIFLVFGVGPCEVSLFGRLYLAKAGSGNEVPSLKELQVVDKPNDEAMRWASQVCQVSIRFRTGQIYEELWFKEEAQITPGILVRLH